jgi:hypothetical protein
MHAPTVARTKLDPASRRYRPRLSRPGSRQHGQSQLWEVVSADGHWLYLRTEESGTPWRIYRLDEHGNRGATSTPAGSLLDARAMTAAGAAQQYLVADTASASRSRCTWRSRWGTSSVCSRPAVLAGRCDNPVHAEAGA